MSELTGNARVRIARQLIVDLAIMTAIGIVLALIGPFGSYSVPFAWRLVYWLTLSYAGYCFYRPLSGLIVGLGPKLALPPLLLWVLAVVLATIPMAIVVWIVGYLPGDIPVPTLEAALQHYFAVLVIGAMITLVFNLLQGQASGSAVDVETPGKITQGAAGRDTKTRFLDRLPPELGTRLIALEMEDHYVRAHTELGSDLVLMRMRDAVAELDELEGMQVHRSWWVARHAVEDVRREGRNVRLILPRDLEAPVSRANVQPLKDAGWI